MNAASAPEEKASTAPATAATSTALPAPPAMAEGLSGAMLSKTAKSPAQVFLLALTGGAFIALGFIYYVVTQQGAPGDLPLGLTKLIGGVAFSTGLYLVLISGSDLFTGSTLTIMPLLQGRLKGGAFALHWLMSILGNFVGSVLMAVIIVLAGTHASNGSAFGLVALNATLAKVSYDWHQAFFLGLMANFAVCLSVWMAAGGKTLVDKALAVIGPISLFVASGFEHSVANMFMLPLGWMIKTFAGETFWNGQAIADAGVTRADFDAITIPAILVDNLIPVILGNIVGGSLFVGAYFWACYLRRR